MTGKTYPYCHGYSLFKLNADEQRNSCIQYLCNTWQLKHFVKYFFYYRSLVDFI